MRDYGETKIASFRRSNAHRATSFNRRALVSIGRMSCGRMAACYTERATDCTTAELQTDAVLAAILVSDSPCANDRQDACSTPLARRARAAGGIARTRCPTRRSGPSVIPKATLLVLGPLVVANRPRLSQPQSSAAPFAPLHPVRASNVDLSRRTPRPRRPALSRRDANAHARLGGQGSITEGDENRGRAGRQLASVVTTVDD
jgi:hypothetical protein